MMISQATDLHPQLKNYANNWAFKDFITIFLKSAKQEKGREAQKVKQDRFEYVPT